MLTKYNKYVIILTREEGNIMTKLIIDIIKCLIDSKDILRYLVLDAIK